MPPLTPPILPAPAYSPGADLCVVSCFYNPARFATKLRNCQAFLDSLHRSNLPHLLVECAFGEEPFTLPASPRILHVRGRDVMWQKERLLNLAISRLDVQISKVAWIDCDVLFASPDWAAAASTLLDRVPIVQLFDRVIRLPRGHASYLGQGDTWASFAATSLEHPNLMLRGDFARHGHTGFAWAARRELLEKHGLYDACISGSGDHMMAHGFCGDWASACIDRILGANTRHREHFIDWCKRLYKDVRAQVGVVPGTLLHLWHGEMESRRYVLRNQELAGFNFDPTRDIRIGESGCWEWASEHVALHRWALDYYSSRREDG